MCAATSPAVLAVVKADAYGHGAAAVATALEREPCIFGFGVANVSEALELSECGVTRPIYVLSPALAGEREIIAERGWIPAVSSAEEARRYSAAAAALGTTVRVQLVFDTGMGRMGARPAEAFAQASQIASLEALEIDSISSHLPSADEDEAFTRLQLASYRELVAELRGAGIPIPRTHIANSAGTMGYPPAPGELVRAGLMLYGCAPIAAFQGELRPALELKTRVTLVRDVPAAHGISYGRTFITRRPTVAATLSAGYADGYLRHLSNTGADVLLGGTRCALLGRVTMDQIVVDATDLPVRPREGDEAVLLGTQGTQSVSVAELADRAGTIPWEVFTGLCRNKRVARVIQPGG